MIVTSKHSLVLKWKKPRWNPPSSMPSYRKNTTCYKVVYHSRQKGRNLKDTPAVKPLLIRETNGAPRSLPWYFRYVVGMINYLSGSARPDVSFVVHQVTRFCAEPKQSYEKDVMRIARCVQTTSRFGTFWKVDKIRRLEVCVDVDFAGLWSQENALDLNSVLSRIVHAALFFGCPF